MEKIIFALIGFLIGKSSDTKEVEIGAVKTTPDLEEAETLVVYVENDYSFYQRLRIAFDNLHRKQERGIYNPEKAWKIFLPICDAAARQAKRDGDWRTFNKATRELACQILLQRIDEY